LFDSLCYSIFNIKPLSPNYKISRTDSLAFVTCFILNGNLLAVSSAILVGFLSRKSLRGRSKIRNTCWIIFYTSVPQYANPELTIIDLLGLTAYIVQEKSSLTCYRFSF